MISIRRSRMLRESQRLRGEFFFYNDFLYSECDKFIY
jgi:hypothetical protein